MYIGDNGAPRKSVEAGSSIVMTCNILNFLDASPMTLFEGAPEGGNERDEFFEENFESFISCMIASDQSVRRLAAGVGRRLFADEAILKSIRTSKKLETQQFKGTFWKLT